MQNSIPYGIKTIGEYHKLMQLPKPQHPLVSLVKFEDIQKPPGSGKQSYINGFYSIALKRSFNAKMLYGQQEYDFDEGVLAFVAPNQVLNVFYEKGEKPQHTGWLLMVHPDFLWNTPLAKKIKSYDFFGYKLNEALHLSEKEEAMLSDIMQQIEMEYHSNIDRFSQDVMIAHLELLLKYSERFYERQFITRKISNHSILSRLDELLDKAFQPENLQENGIPSVGELAENVNLSPNYLSSLLNTWTGQSTQQLIHDKLITAAKEKLSTSELSVSEISFALGFEHPQSFSKLFRSKTNLSPLEFRKSFN